MLYADICVAGAGIIGLALALELHNRGARVIVIEAGSPLLQASTAAAGMLAAEDPDNPPQLLTLSRRSRALYPQFLAQIEELGGLAVPFQTSLTVQQHEHSQTAATRRNDVALLIDEITGETPLHLTDARTTIAARLGDLLAPGLLSSSRFQLLHEHSLDPRQLAPALLAAVGATGIQLLTGAPLRSTRSMPTCVHIETATTTVEAAHFVDCRGAWSVDPAADPRTDTSAVPAREPAYCVLPVKGQMLSLAIPPQLPLDLTFRTPHFYIVPRLHGPQAGRAIIGATVEQVGFDKTVHASAIAALHAQAAALVPALAKARVVETWAGLRPATADRLPLLGAHPCKPRHFVATGHFRNGILLAPATAQVMADLLLEQTGNHASENHASSRVPCDRPDAIDLSAFSPARFLKQPIALA